MTESVYRYKVKELNSRETEERLICGTTEEQRNIAAVNNYGENERFEVISSEYAGEVDVWE